MSAYGTMRHHGQPSVNSTPASTTLFCWLTWEGTVPLEIRVDSKELPANSDRGLECYYIQAPCAAGKMLKEEEWWFESEEGTLLKWHWLIGLIYNNHTISASIWPPSQTSTSHYNLQVTPLKLILHLASPPTEKLLLSPSAESCKQAFMGQLKEADFVRWGNTKRMTGLRKQDQDGIWEGIKEHNFDDYWRVASKIVPTTAPARSNSPPPSTNPSMHTRPPPVDPQSAPDRDNAYSVRSVPVRLYLPDGPVMQDVVPPTLEDGAFLSK
ncbi:hypothetical protein BDR04DRAFT_1096788 [Suillus decipiens]|nr:hypothetical protein BDR04DRAFT_1096788 [Suillus decipiens]